MRPSQPRPPCCWAPRVPDQMPLRPCHGCDGRGKPPAASTLGFEQGAPPLSLLTSRLPHCFTATGGPRRLPALLADPELNCSFAIALSLRAQVRVSQCRPPLLAPLSQRKPATHVELDAAALQLQFLHSNSRLSHSNANSTQGSKAHARSTAWRRHYLVIRPSAAAPGGKPPLQCGRARLGHARAGRQEGLGFQAVHPSPAQEAGQRAVLALRSARALSPPCVAPAGAARGWVGAGQLARGKGRDGDEQCGRDRSRPSAGGAWTAPAGRDALGGGGKGDAAGGAG
jgi:hypothetical protein